MFDRSPDRLDRRSVLQAMGVSSLLGLTGYAASPGADGSEGSSQERSGSDQHGAQPDQDGQILQRIPAVDIPVIDAYYGGEKVWFIHTSTSDQRMAEQLTEMIDYPTLHAPNLADGVDLDAIGDIYVFKNGVDRSDAEPWGGGPFGYQIDVLDAVPDDESYTSLRHPHLVTWNDDADPEILESVGRIEAAKRAGRLSIEPTDAVVTAPVVSWPGGPFGSNLHMGMGPAEMNPTCTGANGTTDSSGNRSDRS